MSFVSNCLNSIPIVGHAKGILHYVAGDTEGGNRAMFESTRSTAVIAGGALGAVAGPAGAVGLGLAAGALMDTGASIVTDTPTGIIKGIDDIGTDISNGEIPVGSVLTTAIHIGADCFSGLGGSGIAKAASTVLKTTAINTGKQVGKDIFVKQIIKIAQTGIVEKVSIHVAINTVRSEIPHARRSYSYKNKNKNSTQSTSNTSTSSQTKSDDKSTPSQKNKSASASASASGSGTNPPQKNHNNKDDNGLLSDFFSKFMELLKIILKHLKEEDRNNILKIFKDLPIRHKKSLKTLWEILENSNCLVEILTIVINLLIIEDFQTNLNFLDFISFAEFASTYYVEAVRLLNTRSRACSTTPRPSYDDRIDALFNMINNDTTNILTEIRNKFFETVAKIQTEISPPLSHDFRNICAAVYHYFKHCDTDNIDEIFSVKDYYEWIRKLLKIVQKLPEYLDLCNSSISGTRLTYERYVPEYDRRILIVLSIQDGKIILSTVYVRDRPIKGDKDGDEFINGKRRKK